MRWHILIGVAAMAFGALTFLSGGTVLWGPQSVRAAAGDIVLPVVWFNALSGLAYMVAGAGIALRRRWASALATMVAVAIALMLGVLVAMIIAGVAWEMRTLIAMSVRLGFWLAVVRFVDKSNRRPAA
ncbi:hypothetical protein CLV78_108129 [Aliiruegeria haliotis]|uniref:DUF4345 domain-containing protein n=1 Tax=Aliiruegeria haliotis TaxID=1280846 RepID=A0A2T0RL46_9RHOB|nr:hypothetical protein [Aliiruegeria haliotis]PRY21857.1 hypothetical protein CLV78_108129 [Aliiruegeria haliotis]